MGNNDWTVIHWSGHYVRASELQLAHEHQQLTQCGFWSGHYVRASELQQHINFGKKIRG
jgi:hypothetical protein